MPAKISITLTSEEHDLLREVVTLAKEAALAEAKEHSKGHDAVSIRAAKAAGEQAMRLTALGKEL